jgi:hypothetical protein
MLKVRFHKAALAAGLAAIAIPAAAATLVAPAQAGIPVRDCQVYQYGKSVTAYCAVPRGQTVVMRVVCKSGAVRLSKRVRAGHWKLVSRKCNSGVRSFSFIN